MRVHAGSGKGEEMKELSDRELLIRVDERVNRLDHCMNNHLRHHWAVELTLVAALLTAVLGWVLK